MDYDVVQMDFFLRCDVMWLRFISLYSNRPDNRSDHLPDQVQWADLWRLLWLHLGIWVWLGCHHPDAGMWNPLLLSAPLWGWAPRQCKSEIYLLHSLKTLIWLQIFLDCLASGLNANAHRSPKPFLYCTDS